MLSGFPKCLIWNNDRISQNFAHVWYAFSKHIYKLDCVVLGTPHPAVLLMETGGGGHLWF